MNTITKFLTKDVSTDTLQFTLGNGQVVKLDLHRVPTETLQQLARHGGSQKVGDAAANCAKDRAFGAAFAQMQAVVDNLYAGKWNAGRETSITTDLATALANLKDVPLAEVVAAIAKADEDTLKGWLKNKVVAAEVQRLRAERAERNAEEAEDSIDDIEI